MADEPRGRQLASPIMIWLASSNRDSTSRGSLDLHGDKQDYGDYTHGPKRQNERVRQNDPAAKVASPPSIIRMVTVFGSGPRGRPTDKQEAQSDKCDSTPTNTLPKQAACGKDDEGQRDRKADQNAGPKTRNDLLDAKETRLLRSSSFMAAGQKQRASGSAPKALLPPTD